MAEHCALPGCNCCSLDCNYCNHGLVVVDNPADNLAGNHHNFGHRFPDMVGIVDTAGMAGFAGLAGFVGIVRIVRTVVED